MVGTLVEIYGIEIMLIKYADMEEYKVVVRSSIEVEKITRVINTFRYFHEYMFEIEYVRVQMYMYMYVNC